MWAPVCVSVQERQDKDAALLCPDIHRVRLARRTAPQHA